MQLDLFDHRPAAIFVFPHARRHALVVRTAKAIASLSGTRRQACWDCVIVNIVDELTEVGLSRAAISEQLRAFREAVRMELVRRAAA